jgi:hypothetical protein
MCLHFFFFLLKKTQKQQKSHSQSANSVFEASLSSSRRAMMALRTLTRVTIRRSAASRRRIRPLARSSPLSVPRRVPRFDCDCHHFLHRIANNIFFVHTKGSTTGNHVRCAHQRWHHLWWWYVFSPKLFHTHARALCNFSTNRQVSRCTTICQTGRPMRSITISPTRTSTCRPPALVWSSLLLCSRRTVCLISAHCRVAARLRSNEARVPGCGRHGSQLRHRHRRLDVLRLWHVGLVAGKKRQKSVTNCAECDSYFFFRCLPRLLRSSTVSVSPRASRRSAS